MVDANPADYDERFTYLGQLLRKDNLCSRDAASEYSNAKSVLLPGLECCCVFEREKMETEKIRSFHDGVSVKYATCFGWKRFPTNTCTKRQIALNVVLGIRWLGHVLRMDGDCISLEKRIKSVSER